ncbi:O-antigen ligase family protein [Agromyces intestinalis]|uniref:O-antigen ligase family protein n=1 Tax=Agromyces intestinalis TaxID=2592652 RepID=A0A5C1YET1_9MICO|nr:O-antigen ligase family protein [Agromyces intestinalis]QEO13529.1 O-antigen ligase family protein [Agromyces intestinalis]
MSEGRTRRRAWPAILDATGSARFAQAIAVLAVGISFSTHAIVALIGWPGLVAALALLILLAASSLVARWRFIEWYGILPISILVFVAWCVASLLWTDSLRLGVIGVLYLLAFGVLGVYIALMRDTIQVVRAFADVLRVLLGLSLALEVLSGILLDLPIAFLGIEGDIAALGPIQGIFGTRNMLGFVALIGAVTFVIEWRTRLRPRLVSVASVVLAGLCVVLSGSPTTWIALAAVLVAAAALYGLRRVRPATRWRWQIALVVSGLVALVLAWLFRLRIIETLDARAEFDVRLDVWREASRYLALNPLQGWGWVGRWPQEVPYTWIERMTGRPHSSALSAYIDVYFQVGVIGVALFAGLIGVALVRAWLLASSRKSPVYIWPALMLVILAVTSFAESFALVEGGWMLLVLCAVKAARDMSWRDALRTRG